MNEQFTAYPDGHVIFDPAGLVSAKLYPARTSSGRTIPSHIDVKHANGERYMLDSEQWGRVQVAMLTPKMND
jgi:hypothetical protein